MRNKITKEEFLERSKIIHDEKYNYNFADYKNMTTNISILCNSCGKIFTINPSTLVYKKRGCKCQKPRPTSKWTQELFIKKSKEVHGNRYDHTFTIFTDRSEKVQVKCTKCNNINFQLPSNHFKYGCMTCDGNKPLTKEIVKERGEKIHGDKYDYSKVEYINNQTKVEIICKEHCSFFQSPANHFSGKGCPTCARINNSNNTWKYSVWEKQGLQSKNFDGFKIYILEVYSDTEKFLKIGKTYTSIKKRFKGNKIPYKYRILEVLNFVSGNECSIAEQRIKNDNKEFNYIPKHKFHGMYECYSNLNKKQCLK